MERKPRSLFFPLLLIAAGIFIFLINIGTIEGSTWENISMYWPVILIIGGLDGLYKHDGWVGPLVLLGLGTVFLLGNLHYLPMGAFPLLLRFWPVLLVAIGLDIAFGHRGSAWNSIIRVGLGVLLVAAVVWMAVASPFGAGMKSVDFSQSLEGATSSDIMFSIPVGDLGLTGGAPVDMLVTGTAGIPKNMDLNPSYSSPVNGRSALTLDGEGVVFIPVNASMIPWEFKLNPTIPMDLTIKVAVGQSKIDLTDAKVKDFKSEMGVGRTIVKYACTEKASASVQMAVGEVILEIPKGCRVTINADTGLVSTSFPAGFHKVDQKITSPGTSTNAILDLNVDLAVGTLIIRETE